MKKLPQQSKALSLWGMWFGPCAYRSARDKIGNTCHLVGEDDVMRCMMINVVISGSTCQKLGNTYAYIFSGQDSIILTYVYKYIVCRKSNEKFLEGCILSIWLTKKVEEADFHFNIKFELSRTIYKAIIIHIKYRKQTVKIITEIYVLKITCYKREVR